MENLQTDVSVIVALLAAALVVGLIAERLRLPYSVALLLAALPLESHMLQGAFRPTLLFIFLPALVFEAAWNVHGGALRRMWRPVAILSVAGVLVTIAMVGFGLSLAHQLPLRQALLLGAILAATDPIAVVPLLRRLRVPEDLAAIIEGESLFNDGIAIVLYGTFVSALADPHAPVAPGAVVLHVFVASFGGAALGLAVAFVISQVLRLTQDAALFVIATIIAAYGAYLLAEDFHTSGIFAAVVAGIALRAFRHFPTTTEAQLEVDRFWTVLAFITNALVFLLTGLRIESIRLIHAPVLTLFTIALVAAARIAVTYGSLPLTGQMKHGWNHAVVLCGVRGALCVALALGLPEDLPDRALIIDTVYGVVFVTLVVQGLSMGRILPRLGLGKERETT